MKKTILIALVLAATIGAQAGVITNEGNSDPSGTMAQNLSELGGTGYRQIQYNVATSHSLVGQSFTAAQTALAGGISLKLYQGVKRSSRISQQWRKKIFLGSELLNHTFVKNLK